LVFLQTGRGSGVRLKDGDLNLNGLIKNQNPLNSTKLILYDTVYTLLNQGWYYRFLNGDDSWGVSEPDNKNINTNIGLHRKISKLLHMQFSLNR